jgi:hypothetical protein
METACEVPLIELLKDIPSDYRADIECAWTEEGRCIGHHLMPVGHLMHKAADRISELENLIKSISPQPTMPQPETNLPISGLGGYDQVLRDEFEDGKK